MHFISLDVETANADFSSICQVGIVEFKDGVVLSSWQSLVDPEDEFSGINISIHGIDECSVIGAPTWPEVYKTLMEKVGTRIVAHHTAFDRTAISRACVKYNIPANPIQWLDVARVVRRTWPEFSQSGYGLKNLSEHFKIKFKHHDAAEDARAAGLILLNAIRVSGTSIEEWCTRAYLRFPHNPNDHPAAAANGHLYGERIVFTGSLRIVRSEATVLAALAGCQVDDNITKHTTLLVVGDQDIRKLNGHELSNKHKKAEELIQKKSLPIRIVGESDFFRLIAEPVVVQSLDQVLQKSKLGAQ
jgi:DNA polymerase-3 subunit epsilon